MENNFATIEILNFFNLADADLLATFPDAKGNPIGLETAKSVLEMRAKLGEAGFTDIAQLMKVKGVGDLTIGSAIKRMDAAVKYKGMVKSRTLFTYANGAPTVKEYEGKIAFEKAAHFEADVDGKPLPKGDETTFELYYAPELNQEQLFKTLRGLPTFRTNSLERVFAMQTRNNLFVATSIPNYSVYTRDIWFANKFRIASTINNPHPPYQSTFFPTSRPNPYMAVAIKTDFYGNQGYLSFDSPANRVRPVQITAQNPNPGVAEYFDISGIISDPWPGAHPLFKNFTLMNYGQSNITGNDPREFIMADNNAGTAGSVGSQNGLQGSNNQVAWLREHQLRYVEVVENMSLESVVNPTHTGSGRWFMSCATTGAISAIQVLPGAAIPTTAQFDMYVFYGYWDERSNITSRVAFKSKTNGRFLALKPNALGIHEELLADQSALNEYTSFYIENGWGGTTNNINLKTAFGKYVQCWQNVIVADTVSPINNEQFKVYIP